MALDVLIGGANLDANSNVKVALSNTPVSVGSVRNFSENDPGTLTGVPYLRSPEVSTDYRLRVGFDTVLFNDIFNATAQNTNQWSYTFNTLTASQPGSGTLNFGTVQGTTSAHGAFMRTFQYFPFISTAPIATQISFGQFTSALVANEVFLAGLGVPGAATTEPTDGVWLQFTSAGLLGVLRFNGTTTQTGVLVPAANMVVGQLYEFVIVTSQKEVEFWQDDVLLGEITVPVGSGQAMIQGSLPAFTMKYNTGAVSNTNTMRISAFNVSTMDIATNKTWAHQMAIAGQACYAGQNGGTMGTSQAVGTITTGSTPIAPTGAAGSNTAANVTGLGGWGSINAAAGAATDFIATAFTNPASTINITGRNLVVTGVAISVMNGGAAVATTPTTLLWSIAFGSLSVSLNTTETASFATGTTHAPRRVQLGFQSAAIGTVIGGLYAPDIVRTLDTPIVVRPGEVIESVMKIAVGTATASQTIVFNVQFTGYYE